MSVCLTDFRILRAQRILGTSMSKRPIKAARLDLYRYTPPHPTLTTQPSPYVQFMVFPDCNLSGSLCLTAFFRWTTVSQQTYKLVQTPMDRDES